MDRTTTPAVCRCGHELDAHKHYRPGSDCGWCGPAGCPRFTRPTGRLHQLVARLTGR